MPTTLPEPIADQIIADKIKEWEQKKQIQKCNYCPIGQNDRMCRIRKERRRIIFRYLKYNNLTIV